MSSTEREEIKFWTGSTKKDMFIKESNIFDVSKQLYTIHVRSGGKIPSEQFYKDARDAALAWPMLDKLDSYESLVYCDIESEMNYINSEFVKSLTPLIDAGMDKTTLTPTHILMASDYGLLDLGSKNEAFTQNDRASFLRDRIAGQVRNYESDGDGLKASAENIMSHRYDMTKVIATADEKYKESDYQGYDESHDESNATLTTTNW